MKVSFPAGNSGKGCLYSSWVYKIIFFWEILDIHNGKLPCPSIFIVIYWNLADIGKGTVMLQDLMRKDKGTVGKDKGTVAK